MYVRGITWWYSVGIVLVTWVFQSVISLRFPRKNDVLFVFTPICFDVRSCFNDVIYIYFPCSNTLVVLGFAVCYDFRIRPMFGSSLRPAVHVLFMLFVFYAYSGVHVLTVYINCMSGTTYHLRAPDFNFGCFCGCLFVHLLSVLCCPIMCLYVLSSMLWCPLQFPHENDVQLSLPPVVFGWIVSCLRI